MKRSILLCGMIFLAGNQQEIQQRRLPASNGSMPGEYSRLGSMRELSGGRVLVVEDDVEVHAGVRSGRRRLVVAELASGSVTEVSREGSGPGEYERLGELMPGRGDTTMLLDGPRRRRLILDGSRVVESDAGMMLLGPLSYHYSQTRGTNFAVWLMRARPPESPMVSHTIGISDSLALVTVHVQSAAIDTITMLRQAPARRIITPGRTPGTVESYHNIQTAWALEETAAMCADSWVAVVRMEPYRVEWRSPDGRWMRGDPIPYLRTPVSEMEKNVWLERNPRQPFAGLTLADPDWPTEIAPQGTTKPTCAPDGRLFVLRNVTAAARHPRYDIIDRRGVRVEQLALDTNQRLLGFGAQALYVVTRDSGNVERLRRYPYPW